MRFQEFHDGRQVYGLALPGHHHRAGALTQPLIRIGHDGGHGNGGVAVQQRLDFHHRNVLAAANDHVLAAAGDADIAGALKAREVRIPAAWVDAIVVDPDQQASYDIPFDAALSGELTGEERLRSERAGHQAEKAAAGEAFSERQAVARRAAVELFNTDKARAVVNYGVGVPDAVAKLIAARGEQHLLYQTIEHGTYGGTLMDGVLRGYARNASAMLDAAAQFDFYSGGGSTLPFWVSASSTRRAT